MAWRCTDFKRELHTHQQAAFMPRWMGASFCTTPTHKPGSWCNVEWTPRIGWNVCVTGRLAHDGGNHKYAEFMHFT